MAKKNQVDEANVASLNPDEMLPGGLKDDFRGTVTEAVYTPWDYDGKIDTPVLAVRLTIADPEDEEPIVQHWSAGNLESFAPSEDGVTPCDEGESGPYAVRVGKRAQLNNNTNFSHLMSSILDAGEASKKFTRENLTASLECLVGLDAHWDRVAQKKRSGMTEAAPAEGGTSRPRDVLVVSEVFGYREEAKPAKGAAKKAAPAPAPAKKVAAKTAPAEEEETTEEAEGEETLDDLLNDLVVGQIAAANGKLKKSRLATLVLNEWAKDPNKAAGVKRVMEQEFINAGPWDYDEKTGVLSIG